MGIDDVYVSMCSFDAADLRLCVCVLVSFVGVGIGVFVGRCVFACMVGMVAIFVCPGRPRRWKKCDFDCSNNNHRA